MRIKSQGVSPWQWYTFHYIDLQAYAWKSLRVHFMITIIHQAIWLITWHFNPDQSGFSMKTAETKLEKISISTYPGQKSNRNKSKTAMYFIIYTIKKQSYSKHKHISLKLKMEIFLEYKKLGTLSSTFCLYALNILSCIIESFKGSVNTNIKELKGIPEFLFEN